MTLATGCSDAWRSSTTGAADTSPWACSAGRIRSLCQRSRARSMTTLQQPDSEKPRAHQRSPDPPGRFRQGRDSCGHPACLLRRNLRLLIESRFAWSRVAMAEDRPPGHVGCPRNARSAAGVKPKQAERCTCAPRRSYRQSQKLRSWKRWESGAVIAELVLRAIIAAIQRKTNRLCEYMSRKFSQRRSSFCPNGETKILFGFAACWCVICR